MARYIRFTEDKIRQLEKEERGKGEREEYTPWIKVGEIRSEGRSHRIPGFRINREHHFFSDLEMYYFYLVPWENDVIDIREQYPLPRVDTARIADELKYEHLKYIGTKVMTAMTTDILLTVSSNNGPRLIACAVKPADKVKRTEENKRTLEKLCIEKTYWKEKGVRWNLITEESLNFPKVKNIVFLAGKWNNPLQHKVSKEKMEILTSKLGDEILKHPDNSIACICKVLTRVWFWSREMH